MAYKDRIVSISPEGRATIVYNGVRFYTNDKSVIAMARRGNFSGAAKRYIGKSSLARSLRQINKQAAKPIYQNVSEALFKKVFKEKNKKFRVNLTKASFAKFRKQYKSVTETANRFMLDNVKEKVLGSAELDQLPEELRNEVDQIIEEETEKAYKEKGEGAITDPIVEKINYRVKEHITDYVAQNPDLDEDTLQRLGRLAELPESELYSRLRKLDRYEG